MEKNPDLVTEFYNQRRKSIIEAQPNSAHIGLASLEEIVDIIIITQNIDDLHERSGSTNVHHLHGNIRYAKSSGLDQESEYFEIKGWELKATDFSPSGYRLRPHVVWFGEAVPAYDEAIELLFKADLLVVIGTSLQVQPAAGLIHFAENASHRYIIDPKANELNVPNGFMKINMNASEGVNHIKMVLQKIIE